MQGHQKSIWLGLSSSTSHHQFLDSSSSSFAIAAEYGNSSYLLSFSPGSDAQSTPVALPLTE